LKQETEDIYERVTVTFGHGKEFEY